jgi:hypothetical protein
VQGRLQLKQRRIKVLRHLQPVSSDLSNASFDCQLWFMAVFISAVVMYKLLPTLLNENITTSSSSAVGLLINMPTSCLT